MKYAMTMDGKIATHTNQSRWISGEESRRRVHQLRRSVAAVMVGVNTVIEDDPLLTCRMAHGRNPVRVVCDTRLRTPLTSRIVQTANDVRTYIATACDDERKAEDYRRHGCEILAVGRKGDHVDLADVVRRLGDMRMDSVLLEGGSAMNWSALEQRIVDEAHVYIAPKIFGGTAKSPVGGQGVALPSDAVMLRPRACSRVGEDYRVESEVVYSCSRE